MSAGLYFYEIVVEAQLSRQAKEKALQPHNNGGRLPKKLLAAIANITKMLWK